MATDPQPVDLALVDDAIHSLMRWLTDHHIPCTPEQVTAIDAETRQRLASLDQKTRARALTIFLAIAEIESFAGRHDPTRGLLWEALGRIPLARFEERLEHEWLSHAAAEEARSRLDSLDTLVKKDLAPREKERQKLNLVPKVLPSMAAQIDADAKRVVDQTLDALRPLLLAAARQVPWARGFQKIQALDPDDAAERPATTLVRISRHLLAVSIDVLASLGQSSQHASEIPTGAQGWSTVLTLNTARLRSVGFTAKEISELMLDGGDQKSAVKRVYNRLTTARDRSYFPDS